MRRYFRYPDGRFAPKGIGSTNTGINESDAEKRARLLKSTDPTELYANRHLLTRNEISERIDRINTEQRLSDLARQYNQTDSAISRGKKIVDSVLAASSTAIRVYGMWNSDAGKAARRLLGLPVPNRNSAFNALLKQYEGTPYKDIVDVANRLDALRRIERAMSGANIDGKK